MPPHDTLSFHCPACGTRLTVPVSLAGVEGPCPSCRTAIRAPQIQAPAFFSPEPELEPVLARPPLPASATAAYGNEGAHGGGPRIRPEPRELPERSPDARISPLMPRKTTEDEELRRQPQQNSRRIRRPKPLFRLLVPLIFLGAAAGIVGVLVKSAKRNEQAAARPLDRSYPTLTTPLGTPIPPEQPASKTAAPETSRTPVGPSPIVPSAHSLTSAPLPGDTTAALSGTAIPAPVLAPAEPDNASPQKILEQFIQAKDAASRVAVIEPQMTEEQLAKTPLGQPLPALETLTPDGTKENKVENMVSYYFTATMNLNGKPTDYTMVVRRRGKDLPKVFVTPVIDQFSNRLAKFAASPGKEIGTFYVCFRSTFSTYDDVPDPEKKFSLRLTNTPYGDEIARAYGSNLESSRFRRLFDDPDSEAHWGVRTLGQVSLRWNQAEDSPKPYLEVLEIKALNWE